MMALLFFLFFCTIILIWIRRYQWSLILLVFTLALCLIMLWYHATDVLGIEI